MLYQPKFKNCFTVEIIKSVGVFLISESDSFVLSGHLYELLTPLINGHNTPDQIVAQLRSQASPAEIYYTLALLEKQGHLIENDTSLPEETAAFYTLLNISPQQATSRLQSLKVAVISYSKIPAEACLSALETLGIQTSTTAEITLILTDDYLQPELGEFNQKALQTGNPWLLIKPTSSTIWIGPIFHPETTACWECLAQRLRANRPTQSFIQRQKHQTKPLLTPPSYLPATLQISFNLAATELAKWIVQGNNKNLENTIITFDTKTLKTTNHTITKRPQCPECGSPGPQEIQPFVLQSQKKTFTADGGHRGFSPTETLQKFDTQISPITGVVRGLLKVPQTANALTPNYLAGHNFATMFDDLYFLKENLRGRSAGKGKTDEQAKASALGEAIERYSGVFQGDEIRQKGSYQTMGETAIHPMIAWVLVKYNIALATTGIEPVKASFKESPNPSMPAEKLTGHQFGH
jgi:ribosomal protein S12 methylthiotransferase accessory factor